MSSVARLQDLPPQGGYKNICYKRVPCKSYFGGYATIGLYLGVTAVGVYAYALTYKQIKQEEIEMRSARLAIMPMLVAERDREYLKQLRRNRDEEARLMAKVPGWVVGTWYGEPIYHTLPKDKFVQPIFQEYYAHASSKDAAHRANVKLWS